MENSLYTIINAIGWSILHSIWQGAIIYIILSLLIMLFPKQSAQSKHQMAFLAMICIFIGFCINIIYYYNISNSSHPSEVIVHSFQLNQLIHQTHQGSYLQEAVPYIVFIYTIGLIIQAVLLSNSFVKLKTLKYKGLHQAPDNWIQKFQLAKQRLGIKRNVQFYLSDLVSIPLTLGHLKPVVLFPVAYANMMTIQQVESILIHELAHIKRNDYLVNLMKVVIESLLFFNPFIWKISKMMEIEREHACDDMVIELTPAMTYAHALVECETLRNKVNTPLTLAASNSKQHLFNRIKRITKMEKKYLNVKQQLLTIMVSVASILLVLWIIPMKAQAQEVIHKVVEAIQSKPLPPLKPTMELENIAEIPCPPSAKPEQQTISISQLGNVVVVEEDTSKLPKHVKKFLKDIQINTQEIQQYYESPEWKSKIKAIEEQSKEMAKKFESPEWKQKVADINLNAKEIEKHFQSEEWKNNIAQVEKSAKEVEKYFQSDDWKKQMKALEKQGQELQKKFESEEWKSKIKAIELNGEKLEKYFNSKEWQDKLKKIDTFEESSELPELINDSVHPQDLNL